MQERPPVRPWEVGLLAAVLVAVAGVGLAWIAGDAAPPPEHSGRSVQDSILLWKRLQAGLGPGADDYPPLASLVSAAFYSVFGPSRVVALGSQFVFLVPYLVGSWWIGRELGGRGGGALTLLAAAGNPWMATHLHGYYLEVGTTALVAAAFALVLTSRGGRVPGPSLALGLVAGLGMLSKWSFLLFVGPGLLWSAVVALGRKGSARWLGLASFGCLVFTLALLHASRDLAAGGFPWVPYALSALAWVLLAVLACRRWCMAGWNAGVGTALGWALSFLVCGWWYFLSVWELQTKASGDAGQGFSVEVSLVRLLATLATCAWSAPLWFAAGTLAGWRLRPLRPATLLAWSGIVLSLAFYLVWRVPPGPRYVLPATVLLLAVSFGWWGRVRHAPPVLGAVLLALGWVQVGSWMGPWTTRGPELVPDLAGAVRISRVPPPQPTGPPSQATAMRILDELAGSGEQRITAVLLPGGRLDPDVLILDAILNGRALDIKHVLDPVREAGIETSLVLVVGEVREPAGWLEGYRRLECWEAVGWGRWCLYRHPTRRDPRAVRRDGPS